MHSQSYFSFCYCYFSFLSPRNNKIRWKVYSDSNNLHFQSRENDRIKYLLGWEWLSSSTEKQKCRIVVCKQFRMVKYGYLQFTRAQLHTSRILLWLARNFNFQQCSCGWFIYRFFRSPAVCVCCWATWWLLVVLSKI